MLEKNFTPMPERILQQLPTLQAEFAEVCLRLFFHLTKKKNLFQFQNFQKNLQNQSLKTNQDALLEKLKAKVLPVIVIQQL